MKKPEFRGLKNKEIFDIIAPRLLDNIETLCDPFYYSNDTKIDTDNYKAIMMDADYVRIHKLEVTRRLQLRFKAACRKRLHWNQNYKIMFTSESYSVVSGLRNLKKALEEYLKDTDYASKKILY